MNGSYTQHSADTLEYQQGRNSAEINVAVAYGPPIQNPYSSQSKEWLDWQIGYDSWSVVIWNVVTETLSNQTDFWC